MSAWATEADVLALTGVTVTADALAHAHGVIDVFSGATEDDTDNLSARDLRLLEMAAAYQAAWMSTQIDSTGRMEVQRLVQDGAEITPAFPDSMVLAPLARRCLAQLSWRGTRTVTVTSGATRFRTFEEYADAWLRDEAGCEPWRPL